MADVEYVVEIASSFKGEQTIAQLDAMTAKLVGAGADADAFQNAVVRVSSALDTARAATVAANSALADGTAQYRQLEKAADVAAKAQEKAANSGVVEDYRAAQAAVIAANSALDQHTAKLGQLEGAAKAAKSQEDALTNTLGNVKKLATATAAEESGAASAQHKAYTESAESASKLEGALNKLGGPLGSLGGKAIGAQKATLELNHVLGAGAGTAVAAGAGIAIVVVAIIAVAAAFVSATVAVARWAVELANTNRDAALTASAFDVLNPKVAALESSFGDLTAQTGLSRTTLQGIAKNLVDAHVAASDLPAALRAAALSEAALGQGGAQQFVQQMQASGKSVQAFSSTVSDQLGGIVAKKMLGLDQQAATFKSNIGGLFGSLNIEPVLTGLSRLVALFDQNTAAGKTIQAIFQTVFQPLIDQADKAAVVVEAFALGFLIGLVKLYIAVKPALASVSALFDFHDTSLSDVIAVVTKAAEYLAPAIALAAVPFVALAVVIGGAVAAVVAIQVGIYALIGAVIAGAAYLEVQFLGAIKSVWDYLSGIDLGQIGSDLIAGLARGITAGAGAVVQSVTGAVTGAIDAAKSALGIHSPSKVFAEIGGYTAEGFAQGVDAGADDAQAAVTNLTDPPATSPVASKAASGQGAAGASVVFEEGAIQLYGVKDAEMGRDMIKQAILDVFEGLALQASGGTA